MSQQQPRSLEMGPRFTVSLEGLADRPRDPWFTRQVTYTTGALYNQSGEVDNFAARQEKGHHLSWYSKGEQRINDQVDNLLFISIILSLYLWVLPKPTIGLVKPGFFPALQPE